MWSRAKGTLCYLLGCCKQERFGKLRYIHISTKITAMYAALLFLVLLGMTVISGIGMYSSFYHQAELEIEISMKSILENLDAEAEYAPAFWERTPVMPGVVLRVTDIAGNVIFENDSFYPSIEEIEANVNPNPPFWATKQMELSNVNNMTIYHAKVSTMRAAEIYEVHFFRTITADEAFLRSFQRPLLLATIFGFIVALIAGYFLSNRILRPIRTMMQTAKKIEVEKLNRRVEVEPTNDELMELGDTFNHMLDRLEAGLIQQQRFVSDASHELRTPVTVLLGYSDLLSRWGRQDMDILDEAITCIRSEAENMQQLIEKLLFLARADQARQVLRMEPMEISELVEDIMKKMALVSKHHDIQLLANDLGTIYADPVTIRQLIRIFLSNAVKYTQEGGCITLKSLRIGDKMKVTIEDNGIGIAKKDQERIFDRFFRVDTSRTKVGGVAGTGLGLSIARWIAEQHGIEIQLESALQKGTKITLYIPIYEKLQDEGGFA